MILAAILIGTLTAGLGSVWLAALLSFGVLARYTQHMLSLAAGALLATFYGATIANLFCLPIADKLHGKLVDEEINRTLIIDGILMIREAKSPSLVREMLLAYLPEKHRHAPDEEEAEAVAA